jgi:hypothetical protein
MARTAAPKTFSFPKLKQDAYLAHIRAGMRRGAATDAVFGSEDPERRKLMREYILSNPEFEEKVLDAEVEATEHVEEALYQAAISGNTAAAVKWLEMHGAQFAEHRGRPPKPASGDAPDEGDSFADLHNVLQMDPRRRHT